MQVFVIRSQNGHYISLGYTKEGIVCTAYDGDATGFTFYTNKDKAQQELEELGEEYYLDCINLSDLPKGKRVYIK